MSEAANPSSTSTETTALTPAPPSTERPPDQPSSAASAGSSAAPKGLKGSGLRFAADDSSVPEWARGKTADEILALGDTFYKAALQPPYAPNAAQPAAPTPQTPVTTPTQPTAPQPPDPQLMYSDPARWQSEMLSYQNALYAQQTASLAAPIFQQQATFARGTARQNTRFSAIWDKYGAEIDAQMASLPPQARTVEAWEMAAKIVAGEHLDEIAQERAAALAARPDTGTLSGSDVPNGSPSPASDPISELFRTNDPAIQKFKMLGKDARDVIAHARNMGHTPERYAEMLKRGTSVTVYETRDGATSTPSAAASV